jgi:hypothetical protein
MWTFFPGALTIFANYNSNIFLINTREMWFSSPGKFIYDTVSRARFFFVSGAFSNNISKFALKILSGVHLNLSSKKALKNRL